MKRTLFFMLLSVWLFAPAAWAEEGEYDISLMNAGTLLDQIGIENIEKVYGLKVSGDLNGTDILTIRKMTNLRCLDMETANIVNGGLSYYEDYITSQNTVGTYFFREKTNLEKIVLPKTVENIEDYSFSGCTALTTVYIGENVTQIRSHVFSGCTALRNLRIEDGTKTLSYSATPFNDCPLDTVYLGRNVSYGSYSPFKNKTTLVSLTIGKQVTSIGEDAFYKCTGLTSITISDGVQTIGSNAFDGCTSLTEITIPNSVTSIGSYAFSGCTVLASVTIPNSVSTIKESTFEDCSGLTEVIIGHSVKTIEAAAFKGSSGLKKVTSLNTTPPAITATTFDEETAKGATLYVPASCKNIYWLHPYWENFSSIENSDYEAYDFEEGGIYYHINGSTERTVEVTYKTPSDRGYSGEVIIPEEILHNDTLYTITSIGRYAFHDCKALAAITVGKNIARIGNGAFSGCTGLTSVTIGESVTSIGSDAFSGCTGLKNLRIEDGTKTLVFDIHEPNSSNLFDGCPLDTVYLGRNYKCDNYKETYYYDLFKGKTSLVSLTIGNQVTSIGGSAFSGCKGLTEVTIPESVTTIGSDAFSGCTGLKNLRIEDGTKTLSLSTSSSSTPFDNCPLDTVYLGRNIDYSYRWSGSSIAYKSPFKNKTTLVSLTIGNQVTAIGYDAFIGCSGLTSVTIGEGVTTIGSSAFSGCYGLTEITIPESVTSIDYNAFKGCSGLTSVTIGEGVQTIDGYAFAYCTALRNLRIEDGTKTLVFRYNSDSSNLFDGCPLDTVYLGRNYKCDNYKETYYYDLFKGKTSLVSLTIGKQVTSIGSSAFSGCKGLTEVTIPESITSIGKNAFYNCMGLTSVTIPNSVTSIGGSAFSGCTGLKNLRIEDGTKTLKLITTSSSTPFDNCPLDTVYLGRNISYSYSPFKNKAKIVSLTIGKGVTAIGDEAFSGTGLKEITIPESITSIGKNAFYNCTGLTSVTAYNPTPVNIVYNGISVFDGVDYETCKLYVLAGSVSIYKAAEGWKEFGTILPIEGYVPETGKDFIPVTVTPEAGSEEISFTRATLTFTEAPVLLDNRVMLAKSDSTVLYPALLTLGEGNTLEITLRYGELKTEGTYLLNIPAGTVSDASGKHVNPEYTYVYTLTPEAGSVPIPEAEAAGITVYNLQGILMLQTDEAAELRTLPAGDYIVNGKKTVIAEQ